MFNQSFNIDNIKFYVYIWNMLTFSILSTIKLKPQKINYKTVVSEMNHKNTYNEDITYAPIKGMYVFVNDY